MTTLSVVYHSKDGHTRIMAEGVHEGAAGEPGVEAELHAIDVADIVDGRFENAALFEALDASDAIVFGCPTYMGGVSGPMKAFVDATVVRWYARGWADKVAAGFTVSSTPSGDKLNALMDLTIAALQHGMIWVGLDQSPLNSEGLNRLSFYLGAAGQADYSGEAAAIMAGDRATGVSLGARVARITHALHGEGKLG